MARVRGAALRGRESSNMQAEKRRELIVFIFLALVLAPIVAVLLVSAFGFAVWMFQIIAGPPSV